MFWIHPFVIPDMIRSRHNEFGIFFEIEIIGMLNYEIVIIGTLNLNRSKVLIM